MCVCGGGGGLGGEDWSEVRSGAGVSVLVCTWEAVFEMDWWWFGVFQ